MDNGTNNGMNNGTSNGANNKSGCGLILVIMIAIILLIAVIFFVSTANRSKNSGTSGGNIASKIEEAVEPRIYLDASNLKQYVNISSNIVPGDMSSSGLNIGGYTSYDVCTIVIQASDLYEFHNVTFEVEVFGNYEQTDQHLFSKDVSNGTFGRKFKMTLTVGGNASHTETISVSKGYISDISGQMKVTNVSGYVTKAKG